MKNNNVSADDKCHICKSPKREDGMCLCAESWRNPIPPPMEKDNSIIEGNKLIIAGGRDFDDYYLLKDSLYHFLRDEDIPVAVISGRCDRGVHTFTTDDGIKVYGADGLGERWANEHIIPVIPFPADWEKFERAAGPIRNKKMAESATHFICFHDGKSKGTASMIRCAEYHKLIGTVIKYK